MCPIGMKPKVNHEFLVLYKKYVAKVLCRLPSAKCIIVTFGRNMHQGASEILLGIILSVISTLFLLYCLIFVFHLVCFYFFAFRCLDTDFMTGSFKWITQSFFPLSFKFVVTWCCFIVTTIEQSVHQYLPCAYYNISQTIERFLCRIFEDLWICVISLPSDYVGDLSCLSLTALHIIAKFLSAFFNKIGLCIVLKWNFDGGNRGRHSV